MPLPRESCANLARDIIQFIAGQHPGSDHRRRHPAMDASRRCWPSCQRDGHRRSHYPGTAAQVAYKFGWLIGKFGNFRRLVKLPFVSIINLVTNRSVFVECLQDDATPAKLAPALLDIMPGGHPSARKSLTASGMHQQPRHHPASAAVA